MGSKLTPEDALAKAREYIKKSLEGAGAIKGNDGYSPKISENAENTEDVYKLDITNADGSFTTPNLISVDALLYDVSDLLGISYLEPTSTVNNYGLLENGYNFSDTNYKLLRYNIEPGSLLYIRSRNDGSNGIFQFQTSSSTYSNSAKNVIGSPYTELYNGYIEAPENATWLIMSVTKKETINGVYKVNRNIGASSELTSNNMIYERAYISLKLSASMNASTKVGVAQVVEIERTDDMNYLYASFDSMETDYSKSDAYEINIQFNEYSATSTTSISKTKLSESGFVGLHPDTKRIVIYLEIESDYGNLASATLTCRNLVVSKNGYNSDVLRENVSISNTLDYKRLINNMSDLPKYYDKYLDEKIQAIRNINSSMSIDCDGFIFVTDLHYPYNKGYSNKIARKIATKTNNKMLICGGDIITEGLEPQIQKNYLQDYISEAVTMMGADNFRYILGNHDFNKMDKTMESVFLEKNNVYNLCMKPFENHVINSERDFSYYWDNKSQKIRYIVINSYDYTRTSGYLRIMDNFPWLNNVLMDTSDGYSIAIITHSMHDGHESIYDENGVEIGKKPLLSTHGKYLMNVCDAVNNKTTYSVANDEYGDIVYTFDFTDKDIEVMFILSGHTHIDYEDYSQTGIPVIATKSDGYKPRIENGAVGTIKEQVVEVVNIDKENRKIFLTRIGSGYDREIDF